jgi:hypothetical protein
MKKVIATIVLSIVALFGALVVTPGVAQAVPSCEEGACLYRNTDYSGTRYTRTIGELLAAPYNASYPGHCLTLVGTAADNMGNSAFNNSGHTLRFYTGGNCTGNYWHSFTGTSAPFTGAKLNLSRAVSSILIYDL